MQRNNGKDGVWTKQLRYEMNNFKESTSVLSGLIYAALMTFKKFKYKIKILIQRNLQIIPRQYHCWLLRNYVNTK